MVSLKSDYNGKVDEVRNSIRQFIDELDTTVQCKGRILTP